MWLSALLDEIRFIKNWADMNIDSAVEPRLPKEFWLPAIIHPKGKEQFVAIILICI